MRVRVGKGCDCVVEWRIRKMAGEMVAVMVMASVVV